MVHRERMINHQAGIPIWWEFQIPSVLKESSENR